MNRTLIAVLVVSTLSNDLNAGLTIPGEPPDFVPKDGKITAQSVDQFRLRLSSLTGIAVPGIESILRDDYTKKRDELLARRARLKPDELVALGGYHYRLNKFDLAFEAWIEASRRSSAAIGNLAVLKLVQGDLLEARRYLSDSGPVPKIGSDSPPHKAWEVRVEQAFRQLVRGRSKEKIEGIQPGELPLDDLWGVQFKGESGEYEAGTIAASQKAKLPEDAIAIVQQLLLWMPHDARLYWLLAELYNSEGDIGTALSIMEDCVNGRRFPAELLRKHHHVLLAEVERQQQEELKKEEHKLRAVWVVAILGGLAFVALLVWQFGLLGTGLARRWRTPRN